MSDHDKHVQRYDEDYDHDYLNEEDPFRLYSNREDNDYLNEEDPFRLYSNREDDEYNVEEKKIKPKPKLKTKSKSIPKIVKQSKTEPKNLKYKDQKIKLSYGHVLNGIYKVIKKIGSGGSGAVFHAINQIDGEEVAIKQMIRNEANSFSIENEIKMGFALYNCEYICKQKATFNDDIYTYIVLEYTPFGDLVNFVNDENQPKNMPTYQEYLDSKKILDVIKNVMHDVCSALKYCHSKNICHNDIKPDNILIFENKNPLTKEKRPIIYKLADLGRSSRLDYYFGLIGTLQYTAPETVKNMDARCDISDMWSVGIVATVLLSGPIPSRDYSESVTQNDINKYIDSLTPYEYEKNRDIVVKYIALRIFLKNLLEVNPKLRITSDRALIMSFLKLNN